MMMTSHGRRLREEALELWTKIPSYSDSRFGVFLKFFVTPNFQSWAEVVRCWPIKSVRHTQTSQSESTFREAFFRSEHPTLFFYSSLPSQLVFSHSVYPNQYFFKWAPSSGFELFSKEERTEDFEPVPTFEVQYSRVRAYFARLYVSVPILSREFGRIDMYYLSYSIMTSWWRHHMWLICHVHKRMFSGVTKLLFSFLKLPNRPISRFRNRNIVLWLLQLVYDWNKFLIIL